jgi:hypothetical protein
MMMKMKTKGRRLNKPELGDGEAGAVWARRIANIRMKFCVPRLAAGIRLGGRAASY